MLGRTPPKDWLHSGGLTGEIMDGLRVILLVLHLMAFALALSAVQQGDWMFLRAHRLHPALLQAVAQRVLAALGLLALSGACVIWLDTGFELRRMLASPKLMAKLSVVAVMLANAALLHAWAFPRLLSRQPVAPLAVAGICACGAISTTSWVYATFLGVARPLALPLGYIGFMALYAAALALAVGIGHLLMRPRVALLMARHQRLGTSSPRTHATLRKVA